MRQALDMRLHVEHRPQMFAGEHCLRRAFHAQPPVAQEQDAVGMSCCEVDVMHDQQHADVARRQGAQVAHQLELVGDVERRGRSR